MAGLGESCTHVAAVLFYLEALCRIEGQRACTEGQCAWVMPSSMKSAQYLPIKELDFTLSRGQKCKFDDTIDGSNYSDVFVPKTALPSFPPANYVFPQARVCRAGML